MRFVDPAKGDGLLTSHLNKDVKRVLIVFIHGVGDVVMFIEVLKAVSTLYPKTHFDLGLAKELGQNSVYPCAVLLDTDWKSQVANMNYDLVFQSRFPMEDLQRPMVTKAEICCEKELGIPPIAKYPQLVPKKIVAVHFHSTAVPALASAPESSARRIWEEIALAGYIPVETHFEHVYHDPMNTRFDFVDHHVRNWPARLDTLMALLGAADAFVGVASGNFHLALSILGPSRVMFLEKSLKVTQFTKANVAIAKLDSYNGEVMTWLQNRRWKDSVPQNKANQSQHHPLQA
jgi:hypothetical protein